MDEDASDGWASLRSSGCGRGAEGSVGGLRRTGAGDSCRGPLLGPDPDLGRGLASRCDLASLRTGPRTRRLLTLGALSSSSHSGSTSGSSVFVSDGGILSSLTPISCGSWAVSVRPPNGSRSPAAAHVLAGGRRLQAPVRRQLT